MIYWQKIFLICLLVDLSEFSKLKCFPHIIDLQQPAAPQLYVKVVFSGWRKNIALAIVKPFENADHHIEVWGFLQNAGFSLTFGIKMLTNAPIQHRCHSENLYSLIFYPFSALLSQLLTLMLFFMEGGLAKYDRQHSQCLFNLSYIIFCMVGSQNCLIEGYWERAWLNQHLDPPL